MMLDEAFEVDEFNCLGKFPSLGDRISDEFSLRLNVWTTDWLVKGLLVWGERGLHKRWLVTLDDINQWQSLGFLNPKSSILFTSCVWLSLIIVRFFSLSSRQCWELATKTRGHKSGADSEAGQRENRQTSEYCERDETADQPTKKSWAICT